MAALKRADFYYGSLLSVLINGGIAPALFEKDNDKRQIYNFSTNNDSYLMYVKFNTSPTGTKNYTWSFTFSDKEIEEIKKYNEGKERLLFAFICCQKQVSDYNQDIAIVNWEEFIRCVDINKKDYKGTHRLSIRLVKGARAFRVYGSSRADLLEGKDNTIKIERNRLMAL